MRIAILNSALEPIEFLEGEAGALLEQIGDRNYIELPPLAPPPSPELNPNAGIDPPLAAEARIKVAIYNEDGFCVNVLEGTLRALAPFVRDCEWRLLSNTPYEDETMAAQIPSLEQFDEEFPET